MNINVQHRPSVSRAPHRAALWLALVLLFFIQLASATHHHDEHSLKTHDCAVCSQLQAVKHTAVGQFQWTSPQLTPTFFLVPAQVVVATDFSLVPPARAPPISSH